MFHDGSFLALKIVNEPKRAALEILLMKVLNFDFGWSVDWKRNVFN